MPMAFTTAVARKWIFGDIMCNFYGFGTQGCALQSILTLACIGVDRFVAICKPLQYHTIITTRRCCILIGYAWVQCLIINLPPLFGWGEYEIDIYLYGCYIKWTGSGFLRGYNDLTGFSTVFPATGVIIFCYSNVYRAWRKSLKTQPPHLNTPKMNIHSKFKREVKAAKMFVILVGILMLSWVPFQGWAHFNRL